MKGALLFTSIPLHPEPAVESGSVPGQLQLRNQIPVARPLEGYDLLLKVLLAPRIDLLGAMLKFADARTFRCSCIFLGRLQRGCHGVRLISTATTVTLFERFALAASLAFLARAVTEWATSVDVWVARSIK